MATARYRWVVLLLSYVCMLAYGFGLQSVPPVLTLIVGELGLSYAEGGMLSSLFVLPAIFLSILAGMLADWWNPFRVGVISLCLALAGALIFATSGSFVVAGLGRVIAGLGAATVSIQAARMITQWFGRGGAGTAMGIYNTAMPVAAITSFSTFGTLGQQSGWRTPIFVSALVAVLALAAFLLLYRPAPAAAPVGAAGQGRAGVGRSFSLRNVGSPIWLVALCWMWFNAASISFSTFAPDFFVSRGYEIGAAGLLASLLMWGSLGLSPIIGRLTDRIGRHELFIGAGGILLAIAISVVARAESFIGPMLVMAVAVALVPAPVFSLPAKILAPQRLGFGFGVLSTLSSTGIFFGPYLAGLIRDRTHGYEASFVFLSVLALLITATAVVLRARLRQGRNGNGAAGA